MSKIIQYPPTLLLAFFFIASGASFLYAQDNNRLFDNRTHRIGFIGGYGTQRLEFNVSELNDEDANNIKATLLQNGQNAGLDLNVKYTYDVKFFQFQYYLAILKKKTWGLDLLFQPQYNLTVYRPDDNVPKLVNGEEFGINVGALIRKNFFNDFLSVYFLASIGPHYVSGTPHRQSSGFIFSDNLFAGVNVRLFPNFYIDLRPGFRHISNANLKKPNGGVNTLVISGGVFYNIPNRKKVA